MNKEFGDKERKTLAQCSLLFVILYVFACNNAIKEHYMPLLLAPLVLIVLSIVFYIIMGRYSSAYLIKDKILCSIVSSFLLGGLVVLGWSYTHPKIEDLKAEAIKAEEQYFFLSSASLDHGRICEAGKKAFKLHEQTGNIERAKLIAHGLIQDKCF